MSPSKGGRGPTGDDPPAPPGAGATRGSTAGMRATAGGNTARAAAGGSTAGAAAGGSTARAAAGGSTAGAGAGGSTARAAAGGGAARAPAARASGAADVAPRRTRARRGDGERLRDEIIVAATRLLVEKGSEELVSVRAIAEAVGVTPPSIYLHFADKEELFVAVCDHRFQELDRRMKAVAAEASDPLDEVRRRGEAYIRFGLENPEEYRILFLDRQPRCVTAEKVEEWAALQNMVAAVQRCMDAGMMAPDDPVLVTIGLWSSVHGITSLLISMPDFPWPPLARLVNHILDTAATGLLER